MLVRWVGRGSASEWVGRGGASEVGGEGRCGLVSHG